jgi:hypothetical protein
MSFSFKFDCFISHLTNYGTWLDRTGDPQTYFYGANHGLHVCACSADDTCRTSSPIKNACNCHMPPFLREWQTDAGRITNATALPVTGFRYGFLQAGGESRARVTIGPLECSGEENLFGDPGSGCASLRWVVHLANLAVTEFTLLRLSISLWSYFRLS